MKVTLAGYNIDKTVIYGLASTKTDEDVDIWCKKATPETLSAAYARISREDKDVDILRMDALINVPKAQQSNEKIVFGMGHNSVAEHAVLNFDIIGISRYAIEFLERHRLCSYTEKSQRYTRVGSDFMIPREIRNKSDMVSTYYRDLIEEQQELYVSFYSELKKSLMDKGVTPNKADGSAKEDARYVTMLSVTGQLGMTVNARNLDLIIERCLSSELSELVELGHQLRDEAISVVPSLLRSKDSLEGGCFNNNVSSSLYDFVGRMRIESVESDGSVPKLLFSNDWDMSDRRLAAEIVFRYSKGVSFDDCLRVVGLWSIFEYNSFFDRVFKGMKSYDSVIREFEHIRFKFLLEMSASCYAQLKRHRMSSQSVLDYDLDLPVVVPPSFYGVEGMVKKYKEFAKKVHRFTGEELEGLVQPYALLQGSSRKVLMTMNLRDLYHFSRLREDGHAQWEIRSLARNMCDVVREKMPHGSMLLCGKDEYDKVYGKEIGFSDKE